MKIKYLEIKDFRGFSNAEIKLDSKSTIFFGVNGVGKTSLLRAINLLYASIINKSVNRAELRQKYNIELNDIRFGKPETFIQGEFIFNSDKSIEYGRGMSKKNGYRFDNKKALLDIAKSIQESYKEDGNHDNIPVFVNYGTNRLVLDIPLRIKTHHEFDVFLLFLFLNI